MVSAAPRERAISSLACDPAVATTCPPRGHPKDRDLASFLHAVEDTEWEVAHPCTTWVWVAGHGRGAVGEGEDPLHDEVDVREEAVRQCRVSPCVDVARVAQVRGRVGG